MEKKNTYIFDLGWASSSSPCCSQALHSVAEGTTTRVPSSCSRPFLSDPSLVDSKMDSKRKSLHLHWKWGTTCRHHSWLGAPPWPICYLAPPSYLLGSCPSAGTCLAVNSSMATLPSDGGQIGPASKLHAYADLANANLACVDLVNVDFVFVGFARPGPSSLLHYWTWLADVGAWSLLRTAWTWLGSVEKSRSHWRVPFVAPSGAFGFGSLPGLAGRPDSGQSADSRLASISCVAVGQMVGMSMNNLISEGRLSFHWQMNWKFTDSWMSWRWLPCSSNPSCQ